VVGAGAFAAPVVGTTPWTGGAAACAGVVVDGVGVVGEAGAVAAGVDDGDVGSIASGLAFRSVEVSDDVVGAGLAGAGVETWASSRGANASETPMPTAAQPTTTTETTATEKRVRARTRPV
jgi:hypothetical protein